MARAHNCRLENEVIKEGLVCRLIYGDIEAIYMGGRGVQATETGIRQLRQVLGN
jgi:hypothetical protein